MTTKPVRDADVETRIGALVRRRRLAAGLTMEELGDRIGVSYQQIQKYETVTNRISVSRMLQIASALGTTTVEIVAEIETSLTVA